MQTLEGKNKKLYELKMKVDEQQYQLQVRNEKVDICVLICIALVLYKNLLHTIYCLK